MDWWVSILTQGAAWFVAILAFDLLSGHAGLLSLGNAALMALGGYLYSIMTVQLGYSPLLAFPIAIVGTTVVGGLLGRALVQLEGDLFALATYGLHVIAVDIVSNSDTWSGGAVGLRAVPGLVPDLPRQEQAFILSCVGAAAALWAYRRVTRSGFGRALRASRDDSAAAHTLGISPTEIRAHAFVLYSALLGGAGVLMVILQGAISPGLFTFDLVLFLLSMGTIGGSGTWRGGVVGVCVVLSVDNTIRTLCASTSVAGPLSQMAVDALLLGALLLQIWHRRRSRLMVAT